MKSYNIHRQTLMGILKTGRYPLSHGNTFWVQNLIDLKLYKVINMYLLNFNYLCSLLDYEPLLEYDYVNYTATVKVVKGLENFYF